MKNVAARNDEIRKRMAPDAKSKIMLTVEVRESGFMLAILDAVKNTEDFGDDPYKEHDFGRVRVGQQDWFWKFDYMDENLEEGCEPKDESAVHILTIMNASEY